MKKLAWMLLNHLEGILNYCQIKVPMGVVEAVIGNIKALLRRGRGYRDMNYLLLKAQRLAATKVSSSGGVSEARPCSESDQAPVRRGVSGCRYRENSACLRRVINPSK